MISITASAHTVLYPFAFFFFSLDLAQTLILFYLLIPSLPPDTLGFSFLCDFTQSRISV